MQAVGLVVEQAVPWANRAASRRERWGPRRDVAVVELNGRTLGPDHPDTATLHTTSTGSCSGLAVNGVETGLRRSAVTLVVVRGC
jgi:hypothetical protein